MIANIITGCRILFSIVMLFFPTFSIRFYTCYLAAGITDMVDGTIARKLGTASPLGEKIDTIADTVFLITALYKLMPEMEVSEAILIWSGIIVLIKVINIILGFCLYKKYMTIHSVVNKITGFMLFIFPLTFSFINMKYSMIVVCMMSTLGAIHEGYIIVSKKTLSLVSDEKVREEKDITD